MENCYCKCGRRMSVYAHECRECTRKSIDKSLAEGRKIVNTGKCPNCGSPLKYNGALHGWWQCSQFGALQFRADKNKPQCNFQTFVA